jgi:signal transduction histidine kinase
MLKNLKRLAQEKYKKSENSRYISVEICPALERAIKRHESKSENNPDNYECAKHLGYPDFNYIRDIHPNGSYFSVATFLGQKLLVHAQVGDNAWTPSHIGAATLFSCFLLTVVLFRAVSNRERLLSEFARKEQLSLMENEDAIEQYGLRWHTQAFAHEIKQPLAGARLALDRLARRPGGEMVRSDSIMPDILFVRAAIEQALKRLGPLRDGKKTDRQPIASVKLRGVFRAVEKWARLDAGVRQIRVHIEMPPKSLRVNTDSIGLQRVLRSLLENSAEAMEVSGRFGTAEISVQVVGDQALISVADDGPGIQDPDALFVPQVSGKSDGWGLGLTLCRQFLEESGGKIRGENRPEGGARFQVSLPLAPSAEGH